MRGVYLPGGRRVDVAEVADPTPGRNQVVIEVEASTICGSDLRAIYREHLGRGPEAYQGVIAGHEPSGRVVACGPGGSRVREGDLVAVYHISGCGRCEDCQRGYQISCTDPGRRAYGWQRDGGHARYLLAEERDLLAVPEPLTAVDGACVACGFGTAYEALLRGQLAAGEQVLVTGLGPVGLAVAMLARELGADQVIGAEPVISRRNFARELGVVDAVFDGVDGLPFEVAELTGGRGVDLSVDCSGHGSAQEAALRSTRRWGRSVFVGEGGSIALDVSADLIHRSLTVMGSWVTSVGNMAALLELLARAECHPEAVVTHRFGIEDAAAAYALADAGTAGKVAITPNVGA